MLIKCVIEINAINIDNLRNWTSNYISEVHLQETIDVELLLTYTFVYNSMELPVIIWFPFIKCGKIEKNFVTYWNPQWNKN